MANNIPKLKYTHQGLLHGSDQMETMMEGKKFNPINPCDAQVWAAAAFDMVYVPQKHKNGCVIASLAMLTGKTYDTVLSHFGKRVFLRGTSWDDALTYLHDMGRSVARVWWKAVNLRAYTPSLALVDVSISHGNSSHAVVLLPNGTVLDPCLPVPTTLAIYHINTIYEVR